MKILIISQYFWPENFKINSLSQLLKKKYKVDILTSIPNYPSGLIFPEYKKNKKKFNKYKGLDIFRVYQIPRGNGSLFSLILNYTSFIFFAFIRLLFIKKKYDLVLTFAPSPIFVGILGVFFSKINGARSVIWILDLWPQILQELKIINSKIILKIIDYVSINIYKKTDIILAQSPSFKKIIEKKIKKKVNKVYYFPSWADDIPNKIRLKSENKSIIKILFTGNIGYAQNLNQVVKATKYLKKLNITIRWVFVGDGRYKKTFLEEINKNELNKYFKFYAFRKFKKLLFFFQNCDFFFISLGKGYYLNSTIPAKLQTYMNFAKPIIASASGETKSIIEKANCGFVVAPNDYKALAKTIIKISKMNKYKLFIMSKNARYFYDKNFSIRHVLGKFENIIRGKK